VSQCKRELQFGNKNADFETRQITTAAQQISKSATFTLFKKDTSILI